MNGKIKARWLRALRSGTYKQGRERLQADGRFCCLGVLCDLAVQDGVIDWTYSRTEAGGAIEYGPSHDVAFLPTEVRAWAGLPSANPTVDGEKLAAWNDGETESDHGEHGPESFEEIADRIERNL